MTPEPEETSPTVTGLSPTQMGEKKLRPNVAVLSPPTLEAQSQPFIQDGTGPSPQDLTADQTSASAS